MESRRHRLARHCIRFDQALDLGGDLDSDIYVEPFNLLLEDQFVPFEGGHVGRGLRPAASRNVALHTWHYLLSRRLEIEAFSTRLATEVIGQDMERAAGLSGNRDSERPERLVTELRSAYGRSVCRSTLRAQERSYLFSFTYRVLPTLKASIVPVSPPPRHVLDVRDPSPTHVMGRQHHLLA